MDAYLVDVVRTGRGKGRPGGALSAHRPVELVAALIEALGAKRELGADDLILGCVTQAKDQGTNIARLAALWAGLESLPGQTLNRFCTSGLDAIGTAATRVAAGGDDVVLAGGIEMPSRVPMFGDEGAWFADPVVAEKTRFVHMGVAADLLAEEHGVSREELDAEAHRSQLRAAEASFPSIVPIEGFAGEETVRVQTTLEDLAAMEPVFEGLPGHDVFPRHTKGTSPALADGASLALIANEATCVARGWEPRARLRGLATVGVDPRRMLHGNPAAVRRAVKRSGVTHIDRYEVNESFAVVPILFRRELDLAPDIVNERGGAVALGHPMGATGGILTATLLESLEAHHERYGSVSICGGAGLATALVWESLAG